MSQENSRNVRPFLEVSLKGTGQEELRIQIPMERIEGSSSDSTPSTSQPSRSTSEHGLNQTLEKILHKVEALPLPSLMDQALNDDYGTNPVELALLLMKQAVIEIIQGESNDTES